jgi:hypothetical protein
MLDYIVRNSISESHFDGTNITDFFPSSPRLGPLFPGFLLTFALVDDNTQCFFSEIFFPKPFPVDSTAGFRLNPAAQNFQ